MVVLKRESAYLLVIAVLAVIIASLLLQNFLVQGSQQQAVDRVKDVYELITENEVEVLTVKEESGLYRILMKVKGTEGDSVQEIYATKDGNLITDKIINTENYKTNLESQKNFIECMKDKKLLIFGQSNEPNTIQQIQLLGNFAYKVYVDCLGANLQVCQQMGIEQIPTIIYEQKSYTGVKTIEWFESLTGCKL
jgi:hypothetical protein